MRVTHHSVCEVLTALFVRLRTWCAADCDRHGKDDFCVGLHYSGQLLAKM